MIFTMTRDSQIRMLQFFKIKLFKYLVYFFFFITILTEQMGDELDKLHSMSNRIFEKQIL